MDVHDLVRSLRQDAETKIILLVSDGLGGLSERPEGGPTELEAAETPHLDEMAAQGSSGLLQPVLPGITTGSGPGHLALFGYDPLRYVIGRGVLSALGAGFDLRPGDVAARGNFCTVDEQGVITDRRAGRISTEVARERIELLRTCELENVELFVEPVRDYRFTLILRGEDLGAEINDTDPQQTGLTPRVPGGRDDASKRTAEHLRGFLRHAREKLHDDSPANMVVLRGFSKLPDWPTFGDVYGLKACAIATYPMYRGLARLLDMQVVVGEDADLGGQVDALIEAWHSFDFFFLHYKDTDSRGEDGDFRAKVGEIEKLDASIGSVRCLAPDVMMVTGDHSTPSRLRSHSWHPVPLVMTSEACRVDGCTRFGETECGERGGLGHFEAKHLMTLAMAHAGRLAKYGA